jgi:undecaprenyl-diphosphatase
MRILSTLWIRCRAWLQDREPVVLIGALLVLALTWAFIAVADAIDEEGTHQFDEWVVRSLRRPDNPAEPLGPRWLQELGRDATALGGSGCLVCITFAVAGYLWLDGKSHLALFLLAAASSGTALAFALKSVFLRPRPSVVPHLSHVASSSFPSAHSMMSAVIYITLGTLVAASVSQRRLKVYLLTLALLLTFAVGASRVYLGVHYPTDVLAGWMAGLAWALTCWLLARWLQQRGTVESADGDTAAK